MDWKVLLTVFGTVFVAELGDKTQLATILFASDQSVGRWTVFLGAAGALVLTSAIGVGVGGVLSHYLSPRVLSVAAGLGFIAIGIWTLLRPA